MTKALKYKLLLGLFLFMFIESVQRDFTSSVNKADARIDRLQWILSRTMGCPNTFLFRKEVRTDLRISPLESEFLDIWLYPSGNIFDETKNTRRRSG
jgi:hypothetical protein